MADGWTNQPPGPSPQPLQGSEEHLQTELNVALAALPYHATERSARRIRCRVIQVRMVREVERLRPELHPRARGRADGLEERDVPALRVRPANRVAAGVAELARGRQREGG